MNAREREKRKRKIQIPKVNNKLQSQYACPIGELFYVKGQPSMKIQFSRVDTVQYMMDPINLLTFD